MKNTKWVLAGGLIAALALSMSARADDISFSTFVQSSAINGAEGGNNSTIAFNFAGNKFVGSVYFGPNNNQLYQTDLTGGVVTQFGTPVPGASGEVVIGASLGQGGFPTGDVYAGSQANGQIYHYANGGGSPTLFATVPVGGVRQIFFDPGTSFGGNMLVTTNAGFIYEINNSGVVTPLVNVGEDAEGIDIATSAWGPFAGDLLVSSEGSGSIRLINPSGVIVDQIGGLPSAETVSFVPLNLNPADPLEGFYVANFPLDIQFASANQFVTQGLLGDAIVTSEIPGSNLTWDIHYNGSGFTVTPFNFTGNSVNQFEDGIFVTPQRIAETTVPEPSSLLLLGSGLLGLLGFKRVRGAVST